MEIIAAKKTKFSLFSGRMSKQEQVLFAKRLAFLMRAGVPILDSLELLKNQMRNKASIAIFEQVIADVANGHFLSTALEKFKGVFGDFAVNIIRVGEHGGILSDNLHYLAEELKKQQALRKKVMSALFYPIFIVVATLGMVGLLTIVVFPKVLPIFSSINVPLPLSTKILIVASRFLIHFGWLVLLILFFGSIGFSFAVKNEKFRKFIEQILLKLPLVGSISQNYFMANFCRTMGLLLKGETKLDDAIRTTAKTTENLVYRQQFEHIAQTVNKGEPISSYLNKHPKYFPEMLGHMVAIGEKAGNLSETFLYLAEMYEQEVDDLTKNLSSLIEPVLMVFMGLMVGFVAVSIITPIYSITQKLHP